MSEMPAAASAQNLGSIHEKAVIGPRDDCVRKRAVKAWPAGATVELCRRAEERKRAAGAEKRAPPMFAVKRTREGALRPCLTQDPVAVRSEKMLPLSGRVSDLEPRGCL